MLTPEHPCPECGGRLELRTGPGRFRRYRGEGGFEIPQDFAVPTCSACGRLWMDTAMVRDVGRVFELERQRRIEKRQVSRPVEYVRTRAPEDFLALTSSANTVTSTSRLTSASFGPLFEWLRQNSVGEGAKPTIAFAVPTFAYYREIQIEHAENATFWNIAVQGHTNTMSNPSVLVTVGSQAILA